MIIKAGPAGSAFQWYPFPDCLALVTGFGVALIPGMGGSATPEYSGRLQNYLIDTGDEVILVDTGLPAGTPEEVPDETSAAFTGMGICGYPCLFFVQAVYNNTGGLL